uniref:UBC core domain-containing protein n=1 Tax=Paramoeba aestuarina TaxID=180227 RepID=A0A6U3B4Y0_9EUKA|eukprot:CAMPEP_0201539626 /NCGR_PEP_ID=MMETSP0161_2-20130828/70509_1 /ASSEMBLY_ACC=CAM_ASM_000251 /TAXON_ID=180227 /ORGANISM="Neoparamoeba aestuarina, Strain SoJaBio B1-5/56/2" /LENGTH=151 /DNA_ID=CAMNT_0047947037 /DNA_START=34 /DNA_END=489 /DNA_ORIENTATION=+
MSSQARRRLVSDLKKLQKEPTFGIIATPCENNIMLWHCWVFGPPETVWEGATFRVSIEYTEEYPVKPPRVRFESKVFHPNVYENGDVCMDLLQKRWSPQYDTAAILTSLQSLLPDPNPESPANVLAAKLFEENNPEYFERIKLCVEDSWLV